jgi:hypothetical protein
VGLKDFLRHGLALDPPPPDPDLDAFMDALAREVVQRRLAPLVTLLLASGLPLSFLASQVMIFAEPVIQTLFPTRSYKRLISLMEERGRVEQLLRAIDEKQAARTPRDV